MLVNYWHPEDVDTGRMPIYYVKPREDANFIVVYSSSSSPVLAASNWCIRMHEKHVPAEYVFRGNSLCEIHFLEAKALGGKHGR